MQCCSHLDDMCSALALEYKMSKFSSSSSSDYSEDEEVMCVKKRITKAPAKLNDFVRVKESAQKSKLFVTYTTITRQDVGIITTDTFGDFPVTST